MELYGYHMGVRVIGNSRDDRRSQTVRRLVTNTPHSGCGERPASTLLGRAGCGGKGMGGHWERGGCGRLRSCRRLV